VEYELARGMKILNDSPAKLGHRNKDGLKQDATDLTRGVKHFCNATGSGERWKDNGWGHLPNHFEFLQGKKMKGDDLLNYTGSRQRWQNYGYGNRTYSNIHNTKHGFPFPRATKTNPGAFADKVGRTQCGLALKHELSRNQATVVPVTVGTPGESRPYYTVKYRRKWGRDKQHYEPKRSGQYYKVCDLDCFCLCL
jgi:hypothetical protein